MSVYAHLAPIDVTPERVARFDAWLDSYVATVRGMWEAKGEDVTTPEALEALALVRLSMTVPEAPEWMPLGEAFLVNTAVVSGLREADDPTLIRYRSALRSIKAATTPELAAALGDHLGIDYQTATGLLDGITQSFEDDQLSGATALYRHYDTADRLLYVGIAADPILRERQHRARSSWAALSVRVEVEWFDTRTEATKAERDAIATEDPVFNIAHAGTRARDRAIDYLLARVAEGAPA